MPVGPRHTDGQRSDHQHPPAVRRGIRRGSLVGECVQHRGAEFLGAGQIEIEHRKRRRSTHREHQRACELGDQIGQRRQSGAGQPFIAPAARAHQPRCDHRRTGVGDRHGGKRVAPERGEDGTADAGARVGCKPRRLVRAGNATERFAQSVGGESPVVGAELRETGAIAILVA